ncbi:MAG: hypothetical protein EAZ85_13730, partial [Bacteroidetes bacterium]
YELYNNHQHNYMPEIDLGVMLWTGIFEDAMDQEFVRWCEKEGNIISTGKERADLEAQRANLEALRANLEAKRADLEAKKANEEAKRANLEAEKAKEESQRADLEAQKAKEESQRANLEAQKTQDALQEIERLKQQLASLGLVPAP